MDFDRKYKENLGCCSQPMFFPDNYLKPNYMVGGGDGGGGFSIEPSSSCSSSSKSFFQQDFQQFPANNAASKTLQFGLQTSCLDPFDGFSYGSAMNLDVYELKPFADENFQTSNGGGGYMIHHHQRGSAAAPVAADVVGLERGCGGRAVNFVIPDEVSCITAENGLYKKLSLIGSAKSRVSPAAVAAAKKTHKGRKKPHVVKGQWTIEEDRWEKKKAKKIKYNSIRDFVF